MTRVLRYKHHLRFHPTSSSATSATRRPFKYNVHKKQTNLQRVLVALHALRPTGPTTVQAILEKISAQAADNEEVLGRRWNQFVHVAMSMLREIGYLEFQVQEDGEEYCHLTEDGIQIMTDADACFGNLWNQLSSFEICRRTGQYIQWKISPNPIRPLTRRELDMENRELERQQQEHMKLCPMLLGLEPHQTYATLQNENHHDLMDVDEVPAAGSSVTSTPIRKSASLHDTAAYPTPQSLPRVRSSFQTVSISPPQTPSARNHSAGILGEDQSFATDQADTITVSNEGEVAVDRVAVITCRTFDWQDIGHVTAISKALQERNDILQQANEELQQKVEVLEKQKEECAHQLDQATSSVERLQAEKRDLQSRSWLFRWRLMALQKILDSAIQDRERYKDQNARLQARLEDIERRRAAIRRIQDAKQAPDDQLLTVIDEHLGA